MVKYLQEALVMVNVNCLIVVMGILSLMSISYCNQTNRFIQEKPATQAQTSIPPQLKDSSIMFEATGIVTDIRITDISKKSGIQNLYTYLNFKVEETLPIDVKSKLTVNELSLSRRTKSDIDKQILVGDRVTITMAVNDLSDPSLFSIHEIKKAVVVKNQSEFSQETNNQIISTANKSAVNSPVYFGSWKSYKIPFVPEEPISQEEAQKRKAYYVGYYNNNQKLEQFAKYLDGKLEWQDKYIYWENGQLKTRIMNNPDGSQIIQQFDQNGNIIK